MSFQRGPSLVRLGLVYCIDPGATRCYSGSGSNMTDLSTSKLNTTTGTFVAAGNNKGYYLNSSTTTTSTSSTSVLNVNSHTICMLFRMASSGTYRDGTTGSWDKIFGYEPSGTDRSPGIWRYPSNRRIHWTYDPGNTSTNFGATGVDTDFALNTDYYVVMRKDGANTHFWVNGTKYTGLTNCANPKTTGNSALNLLYGTPADIFQLKCLQVYNRPLTDNEALQNTNAFIKRLN